MQLPQIRRTSPARVLLSALGVIIAIGTALLSLPFAQHTSISFFEAFFTTVSTVCVTGLKVVPISSFSFIGQCIILLLMQIGGLGLMTFSFFIASLFLNLGMTSRLMAGQLVEFESWSKIKSFLSVIIFVTLGLESIGAGILYLSFRDLMATPQAVFYAVFHSVSAFCNAGITLFDNGMQAMSGNWSVLATLGGLVFAGGIGFMVWYEVANSFTHLYAWLRKRSCPIFTFSLHTKLVLATSLLLIGMSTLVLWGIEHSHSLKGAGRAAGWINALFTSISMRSAGFMVLDINTMAPASLLLLMVLMVIGASPGSTGSGIKTTTFALFCASVRAIIADRDAVEINGRTIPNDQMQKVMAVLTIALSCVILTTFALLLLEPHMPLLPILLEAVSAFSTCGITTGITASLCLSSKLLLLATMIIGRVGLLTLVLSLRKQTQKHLYRYPEERVLLG